jgi:Domain of unknown function (DUF3786)
MSENFLQIQKEYLEKVWTRTSQELEESLPARSRDGCFYFQAFGEPCELYRQEILLGGKRLTGPEGILIALYALHVQKEEPQLRSLKSFKQFPSGMGYQGTFITNAEKILHPYIPVIQQHQQMLLNRFSGHFNPDVRTCDFSFTLYPLPRVALYYIFDLPDEEFPASVTCLFPSNANHFLPVAGLADVAEYTAKKIIELVTEGKS